MTIKELKIIETLQEDIKRYDSATKTLTGHEEDRDQKLIWESAKATLRYVIKLIKETK